VRATLSLKCCNDILTFFPVLSPSSVLACCIR
jgi:hypothetical protein